MPVELAPAGHRTLAADIERADAVDLAGIGNADDHAELLLHVGLRRGRLHPAVFDRRALVLVEIGQDGRGLHRLRREFQRAPGAHHARRRRNRRAVLRHQHAGDAVVGAHTGEIALHHLDHRGRARRIAACRSSMVASSRRNALVFDSVLSSITRLRTSRHGSMSARRVSSFPVWRYRSPVGDTMRSMRCENYRLRDLRDPGADKRGQRAELSHPSRHVHRALRRGRPGRHAWRGP